MLRFTKLNLRNFGPYKGRQELVMPSTEGVMLVYGENMRGKTTLLNAFRYALFGSFIGRGQKDIPMSEICNWEAQEEGDYSFGVELEFQFGDSRYLLSRSCLGAVVGDQVDYRQEMFLSRDAVQLGGDETSHWLGLVMPEEVSRFFLFDGELLQQYEELLRKDSDSGEDIKLAIEKILGLPIVKNGREDLAFLLDAATKKEAKAASANNKTKQLGAASEALLAKLDGHRSALKGLLADQESMKERKRGVDEQLRRFDKLKTLFAQRDVLAQERGQATERLQGLKDRIREQMNSAWKIVLEQKVLAVRKRIESDLVDIRLAEERRLYASATLGEIDRAIARKICSLCERPLDYQSEAVIARVREELKSQQSLISRKSELERLNLALAIVEKMKPEEPLVVLLDVQEQIDRARVRVAEIDQRLEEIDNQTRNSDESQVRKLQSESDQLVRDGLLLDQGIEAERREIGETQARLQKAQDDIKRISGHDLERHQRRRELIARFRSLFAAGVDEYRDRLRKKVEADATDLFLQLTTEPEYSRLEINDNYGLSIVHNSGAKITVRSAGAEHVVALSLMGALQKNAPLSGPIIMDSPFGRLDEKHTRRIVKSLPTMARQVVMLVYESELKPDLAREELQDSLRREYRIDRQTARHSKLSRVL